MIIGQIRRKTIVNIENPYKNLDEKLAFAKVLDKYHLTAKKHQPSHTDFLDAASTANFLQLLEKNKDPHVYVQAIGGHTHAERRILQFDTIDFGLAPEDINPPISPIAVVYNAKFSTAPSHRDYLGAVLGLGLERTKIGDIVLSTNGATIYAATDIAYYIEETLTQVGRVTVKATVGNTLTSQEKPAEIKRINVPSLRLDAVLGAGLNLSRGKATALIDAEKVYVNWKLPKRIGTVAIGDTITIRGMGRIIINAQMGNTKKDRIVLEVAVSK